MSARTTQVLLIAGAVALSVLLFLAPKTKPASQDDAAGEAMPAAKTSTTGNVELHLGTAVKNLPPEQKGFYDKLTASKVNDSLAAFWDARRRPDLAAWFIEAGAREKNTSAAWAKAGNRYYYAVQFTADETEVPLLYESAMRCFNKAIELDPGNTDARIMLASSYVEGGNNPMQGITMLKELEKTDSNNVKLQLNFAQFSAKSGQYDKAIQRLNKVLRIDSNYIEAYLHLADAYEQIGDRDSTVLMLRKYAARTQDLTARTEIDRYIEQLKSKQ